MSKQGSVKQNRILQAIKDLNWDISNADGYRKGQYNPYLIYMQGIESGYLVSDIKYESNVFQYICTIDEFYNYGATSKEAIHKLVKPRKYVLSDWWAL